MGRERREVLGGGLGRLVEALRGAQAGRHVGEVALGNVHQPAPGQVELAHLEVGEERVEHQRDLPLLAAQVAHEVAHPHARKLGLEGGVLAGEVLEQERLVPPQVALELLVRGRRGEVAPVEVVRVEGGARLAPLLPVVLPPLARPGRPERIDREEAGRRRLVALRLYQGPGRLDHGQDRAVGAQADRVRRHSGAAEGVLPSQRERLEGERVRDAGPEQEPGLPDPRPDHEQLLRPGPDPELDRDRRVRARGRIGRPAEHDLGVRLEVREVARVADRAHAVEVGVGHDVRVHEPGLDHVLDQGQGLARDQAIGPLQDHGHLRLRRVAARELAPVLERGLVLVEHGPPRSPRTGRGPTTCPTGPSSSSWSRSPRRSPPRSRTCSRDKCRSRRQ